MAQVQPAIVAAATLHADHEAPVLAGDAAHAHWQRLAVPKLQPGVSEEVQGQEGGGGGGEARCCAGEDDGVPLLRAKLLAVADPPERNGIPRTTVSRVQPAVFVAGPPSLQFD